MNPISFILAYIPIWQLGLATLVGILIAGFIAALITAGWEGIDDNS